MRRRINAVLWAILLVPAVAAFGRPRPAFEAVSIKPLRDTETRRSFGVRVYPGRLVAKAVTLKQLIVYAYRVQQYEVVDGPKFIDAARYDVEAVAAGGAQPDELRMMLRDLLADRFSLRFHQETREIPVYDLTIAKNGPRFRELKPEEPFHSGREAPGHIHFRDLSYVASGLSMYALDRPVLDKTGLKGRYDLDLDLSAYLQPDTRPDAELGRFVLQAALEQFGLKIAPGKAALALIVVDHAQPASPN